MVTSDVKQNFLKCEMETGTKKLLGLEFKLESASSAKNDSKSRYYDTPPPAEYASFRGTLR